MVSGENGKRDKREAIKKPCNAGFALWGKKFVA